MLKDYSFRNNNEAQINYKLKMIEKYSVNGQAITSSHQDVNFRALPQTLILLLL